MSPRQLVRVEHVAELVQDREQPGAQVGFAEPDCRPSVISQSLRERVWCRIEACSIPVETDEVEEEEVLIQLHLGVRIERPGKCAAGRCYAGFADSLKRRSDFFSNGTENVLYGRQKCLPWFHL